MDQAGGIRPAGWIKIHPWTVSQGSRGSRIETSRARSQMIVLTALVSKKDRTKADIFTRLEEDREGKYIHQKFIIGRRLPKAVPATGVQTLKPKPKHIISPEVTPIILPPLQPPDELYISPRDQDLLRFYATIHEPVYISWRTAVSSTCPLYTVHFQCLE
jgi:hypothetical protein